MQLISCSFLLFPDSFRRSLKPEVETVMRCWAAAT